MSCRDVDELESLRARAYGPDADIAADPVALHRLSQLEGRAARTSSLVVDGLNADEGDPVQPAGSDAESVTPLVRGRRRWVVPGAWAFSLLAAVIVTASITGAVLQRVEVRPMENSAVGAARLTSDPDFDIPSVLDYGNTVAFSEFHGLRVLVSPDSSMLSPGGKGSFNNDCMYVTSSQDLAAATGDSYSGWARMECGANAFPPTVMVNVTADMPDELIDAFPVGTALQLVFDRGSNEVIAYVSPGEA